MTAFKRILCVSTIVIGATALLAAPTSAHAQTRINIGIGGPIIQPYPPVIVRPAPVVMPVYRPMYPPVYPPIIRPIDRHDYNVLYRDCAHDPWRIYAQYDCREDAERAAARLQRHGNEVHIQTVHKHR